LIYLSDSVTIPGSSLSPKEPILDPMSLAKESSIHKAATHEEMRAPELKSASLRIGFEVFMLLECKVHIAYHSIKNARDRS
jgi:hypothetical protein